VTGILQRRLDFDTVMFNPIQMMVMALPVLMAMPMNTDPFESTMRPHVQQLDTSAAQPAQLTSVKDQERAMIHDPPRFHPLAYPRQPQGPALNSFQLHQDPTILQRPHAPRHFIPFADAMKPILPLENDKETVESWLSRMEGKAIGKALARDLQGIIKRPDDFKRELSNKKIRPRDPVPKFVDQRIQPAESASHNKPSVDTVLMQERPTKKLRISPHLKLPHVS
jgi:hypothetical protein